MRKVINEKIRLEGPIIHPCRFRSSNLLQRLDEFGRIVISRVSVDYNAILSAALLEVTFGEFTQFARTVDEAIVVVHAEHVSGSPIGRACRKAY